MFLVAASVCGSWCQGASTEVFYRNCYAITPAVSKIRPVGCGHALQTDETVLGTPVQEEKENNQRSMSQELWSCNLSV